MGNCFPVPSFLFGIKQERQTHTISVTPAKEAEKLKKTVMMCCVLTLVLGALTGCACSANRTPVSTPAPVVTQAPQMTQEPIVTVAPTQAPQETVMPELIPSDEPGTEPSKDGQAGSGQTGQGGEEGTASQAPQAPEGTASKKP